MYMYKYISNNTQIINLPSTGVEIMLFCLTGHFCADTNHI